jgi:two-component system response regulator MprA
VDDDPSVRAIFAAVLRREGFEVSTAPDGVAALELLARARERFAILVLDYRMPRLDGLGVLRRLHDLGVEVPVIMISGAMGGEEEAEALRLGAVALLPKPPDFEHVVRLCHGLSRATPVSRWQG